MVRTAYIGLGANLGERGETMRAALRQMSELDGIRVERVSAFYETPPWGKTDQPSFLNAAACITFDRTPEELLAAMQCIERELGRVRHEHWGARTIDLDLLHVDGVTSAQEQLTLPHPYLTERAFVLVPLAEIAPTLCVDGRMVSAWREEVDASGIVRAPEISAPYPLELIAAVDGAGGIGRAGHLLTDCPEDMAHFRRTTMDGIVRLPRGYGTFSPYDNGRHRRHGTAYDGEPAGEASARGAYECRPLAHRAGVGWLLYSARQLGIVAPSGAADSGGGASDLCDRRRRMLPPPFAVCMAGVCDTPFGKL